MEAFETMTTSIRWLLILCLALVALTPEHSAAAAARQYARMVDGSRITLDAVFYVKRSGHWHGPNTSNLGARETLTVWTTRTGIASAENVFTRAVVLDSNDREYPLVYTGGLYQGPPPENWPDQWVLIDPPPLGGDLRLRISLETSRHDLDAVEFRLPYTTQWKARQFDDRTLGEWMADGVSRADPDLIWALLDLGARPHVRGDYDYTPLMVAAYTGNLALARRLLAQGVARDARNRGGATALFYAIIFGGPQRDAMVDLLLARGADPNLGSPALGTPLGWAAQYGKTHVAAALLSHGARPRAAALLAAKEREHWPVVQLLRQALTSRSRAAK